MTRRNDFSVDSISGECAALKGWMPSRKLIKVIEELKREGRTHEARQMIPRRHPGSGRRGDLVNAPRVHELVC
jgi:hypothetical protein